MPVENLLQWCAISAKALDIHLTGTSQEAAWMVLHIWRGHWHAHADIHCLSRKMNGLISGLHTTSNTRVSAGPHHENLGNGKQFITKLKHKLLWRHDLTAPCLSFPSFLYLFSFQLIHSLVLLSLMLVRPHHESTQFTKPAKSRTTTFSLE